MLLHLYIETPKNTDEHIFVESPSYSSFFASYESKTFSNSGRIFKTNDLKIKYMNESYFFFSANTWVLLHSNDQIIFDHYTVRVDLVPENVPLPFEIESPLETEKDEILSSHGREPLSSDDPLSFLYNTPAQKISTLQLSPEKASLQKEEDFFITFWDLTQNKETRTSLPPFKQQFLIYNSTEGRTF